MTPRERHGTPIRFLGNSRRRAGPEHATVGSNAHGQVQGIGREERTDTFIPGSPGRGRPPGGRGRPEPWKATRTARNPVREHLRGTGFTLYVRGDMDIRAIWSLSPAIRTGRRDP